MVCSRRTSWTSKGMAIWALQCLLMLTGSRQSLLVLNKGCASCSRLPFKSCYKAGKELPRDPDLKHADEQSSVQDSGKL